MKSVSEMLLEDIFGSAEAQKGHVRTVGRDEALKLSGRCPGSEEGFPAKLYRRLNEQWQSKPIEGRWQWVRIK